MYRDAAQEDGPPVQQNLRASGFNAAEADLILNPIGLRFDNYIVEFRIVWRPKCQSSVEVNFRVSVSVRSKRLADPGFGNSHSYSLIEFISVQSHPSGDPIS